MRKINRKLLILAVILPAGCLAGLILGLVLGWQLLPVEFINAEIGNSGPEQAEEYVVMLAGEFADDHDVDRARQRLAELDVPNPEQFVAYVADRYVQQNLGPEDADTVNLIRLSEALGVGTLSMVAYISTPTPLPTPTFTPSPTSTPTNTTTPLPTPTPTRMRPTPGPKLSPEPDAKPPRKVSPDGRGQLPAEGDLRAGRPPHRPTSPATAADRAPGPAASPAAPVVHQIEAGDTVYQLAGQYGTSPEAILQANGLDAQRARNLDIGQELVIPSGPAASPATPVVHQIEAGDTIYALAAQYGTSPEAILQANGLDEQGARNLDIGQELFIPGDPAAGSAPAPPAALGVVHQVQAGEALITIARDYGTTVESIEAANGLEGELILAGQELIVPLSPGHSGAPPAQASAPVTPTAAISGTELLTQTVTLAAAPEPISPTLPVTQTAGATPPITTTQAISATEPLTQTAVVTQAAPTEPVTGTTESEGAPAPAADQAASEPPPDTTPAEADPSAELAALEAAMVEAVNAEREARGLPAYRVDETITAVARAHAQDMVARNYVGHTSPEGKRVRDRLRDAGLDVDRAGENYYVTTAPAEEAVVVTLAWFMGHPPHPDNILHDYYTRIGVGVAYRPSGIYIFVLDFVGD